jgi:hypothetical protein
MSSSRPEKSPPARKSWLGFVIGFLVIILPIGGYLLVQRMHRDSGASVQQRESGRRAERPGTPVAPGAIASGADASGAAARDGYPEAEMNRFPPSGASVEDTEPPPSAAAIQAGNVRAERWLRSFHIDPFGGSGVDSLRLFALEVECWHRLSESAASDPSIPDRRTGIEREIRARLERFLDPRRLEERFRGGSMQGLTEVLLLAHRCRDHGVDPAPVIPLIRSLAGPVSEQLDRLPPSTAALFAYSLSSLGVDIGRPAGLYLSAGILPSRPREVDFGMNTIFAMSLEVLVRTDGWKRPLVPTDPTEAGYLSRVLPYLEMTMTLLRRQEAAGDLLSCMAMTGLTRTYGYREGLRVLLSRQNDDGSFGDSDAGGRARVAALLAPTSSALTALSIEIHRAAGT